MTAIEKPAPRTPDASAGAGEKPGRDAPGTVAPGSVAPVPVPAVTVPPVPVSARSRAARAGYLALGLACVPIGIAGFWLPLVPGTVFLIVAAWAFSRSSPRLEAWILSHPRLGPSVRAWRQSGAIPRGVKGFTIASMAVSMAVVLVAGAPLLVVGVGGAACLATAAFVLTRPDA